MTRTVVLAAAISLALAACSGKESTAVTEPAANTAAAIEYCLTHPQWRLSVQTHKYIGVR